MTVAVAADDLDIGVAVDASSLGFIELPAAIGAVTALVGPDTLSGAAGWRTIAAVPRGALVRTSDVVPGLRDDRRLMSVSVGRDRAVGGVITAGDCVDLVSVVDRRGDYVARDVPVADIDPGSGLGRDTVTLVIVITFGADLRIAEALSAGEFHIVRNGDG